MDQAWHAWIYPEPIESLFPVQHVLVTHFHEDHFHPESFPLLNRNAEVLVPTTAGSYLKNKALEAGFEKTKEIHAGRPERLGELEVYSIRIQDHWEFLDETAYLIVENDTAALFLADLWYIPPPLIARWTHQFRLSFASVPWGGSIENMLTLPVGYELGSFDEYYRCGFNEATIVRRNSIMEHAGFSMAAALVDADYMIPGSFGFGWIADTDDLVKPLPVNHWLDQEAFIASLADPKMRSKVHPMYPGDSYDTDTGDARRGGVRDPNHPVTPQMRARAQTRRNSALQIDPEGYCQRFLRRIDEAVARLGNSSCFYRDRLGLVLTAEHQFEIHVINDQRQKFLFEQRRDRFSLRPIDRATGVREIVYMPPSILQSLVDDWGPTWTGANFCGLVKVSSSGWTPYKCMPYYFG